MSGSVTDPRVFDTDPLSGITEWYHYDPDTEGFTIETQQDVGAILELSKAMYNGAPLRWGEFTHVKHIPAVFMMELTKQGIMDGAYRIVDEARFKRWLNERDTNYLRTRPGVV
jgi:hypothetical protein